MSSADSGIPGEPRQQGRNGPLDPVVAQARRAVAHSLDAFDDGATVLIACSGGADSLALAAAAAPLARDGRRKVGAAIVNHKLQPDSDQVADKAAAQCRELGLEPVLAVQVDVTNDAGLGPEAAARAVRKDALSRVAESLENAVILTGHTLNDQAEQVLLSLLRGSGTRSLAGIPVRRDGWARPFLSPDIGLTREQTEWVCRCEGLDWWNDPSNADTSLTRNLIRHRVLPELVEQLGTGVKPSLMRTAAISARDADMLDELADVEWQMLRSLGADSDDGVIALPLEDLRKLPAALLPRILARAVVELGAQAPSFERLAAVEALVVPGPNGLADGVIEVPGGVLAHRVRGDDASVLRFERPR